MFTDTQKGVCGLFSTECHLCLSNIRHVSLGCAPGWRWLDLRKLADSLIANQSGWQNASVSSVVYCTARISGASNPSGQRDQDVYLRALRLTGAVDVIAMGNYVSRTTTAPIQEMRLRVPLGLVNPTAGQTAGKLKGKPTDGVGKHWWYRLQHADLSNAQFPAQIEHITRPLSW